MAKAPRLLRESLIFPYAWGTPLSARRFAERGQRRPRRRAARAAALDAARSSRPTTATPSSSCACPKPELASRSPARSCTLGDDNVAGALTLRTLFAEYGTPEQGEALMHGWSGDRYLQIDCGGTWELVWLTRWDSAEAAARFAKAYSGIASRVRANSPLSGTPFVVLRDRTALVITPGLASPRRLVDRRERGARLRRLRAVARGRVLSRAPVPGRGRKLG